jgi:hypothetical protein
LEAKSQKKGGIVSMLAPLSNIEMGMIDCAEIYEKTSKNL